MKLQGFIEKNQKFFIIAMFLLLCFYAIFTQLYPKWTLKKSLEGGSTLLFGSDYHGPGTVEVSLSSGASFEGYSLDAIIEARIAQANKHPELISEGGYHPTNYVFNKIQASKPWLLMQWIYFFGTNLEAKISQQEGIAAASISILNPFLLARPEFWEMSQFASTGIRWRDEITLEELQTKHVPIYPSESSLHYFPIESKAQSIFYLSSFAKESSPYLEKPITLQGLKFFLYFQNAFDFGFRKVAVVDSLNISLPNGTLSPQELSDCFGVIPLSFDKSVELNYASYPLPDYREFSIKEVPASLTIGLWYQNEEGREGSTLAPDFQYSIDFK